MTMDAPSPAAGAHAYSDGHPLDQIHYREYKVILQPARFASAQSFADFTRLVRHAAAEVDVALFREERPASQIREVLFFDTADCDLYNGNFMLRQRTIYRDGWPADEREVVLKFRHPARDVAAAVDVRPIGGGARAVKFKEELLPLRDGLGGLRSLFSHNCTLDGAPVLRDRPFREVAALFPALRHLPVGPDVPIQLVRDMAVEEVLADVGEVHFGHGLRAKIDVAVWRDRGPQTPLAGEGAFQCRFERYEELHHKARKRADDFFLALQLAARDWVQLGATKTGLVYGRGRGAVANRE